MSKKFTYQISPPKYCTIPICIQIKEIGCLPQHVHFFLTKKYIKLVSKQKLSNSFDGIQIAAIVLTITEASRKCWEENLQLSLASGFASKWNKVYTPVYPLSTKSWNWLLKIDNTTCHAKCRIMFWREQCFVLFWKEEKNMAETNILWLAHH